MVVQLESARSDGLAEVLQTVHRAASVSRMAGLLSHGQKQWREIGMLLMQEPKLLLLDEPVAGMTDEETARTAELFPIEAMHRLRAQVFERNPHLAFDLGAIRRLTLQQALAASGADIALAEPAYEVFYAERNRVQCYPDALDALARIAARVPVEFVLVGSDKAKAGALAIAAEAGIPTVHVSPKDFADRVSFDRALFGKVAEAKPDLLVLAGYMRIIDATVVAHWEGRAINIHPSLLPK